MIETIRSGGIIMIPLGICSVLALAIILERLWNLRRTKIIAPDVLVQIHHWVRQGVVEEAMALCRRVGTPMTKIVMSGLQASGQSRATLKSALEDAGRMEIPVLERNLNWLGICATISPLIGLLGTVTGMIRVFRVLAVEGPGNPFALSSGIAEALVTTATGLIIAIPSLLFYHYFAGKAESLISEMEHHSLELVDLLSRGRED